jgi:hypothetical protein
LCPPALGGSGTPRYSALGRGHAVSHGRVSAALVTPPPHHRRCRCTSPAPHPTITATTTNRPAPLDPEPAPFPPSIAPVPFFLLRAALLSSSCFLPSPGAAAAPPPPRLWRRRVRAPLLCRRAQATLARTAPDRPALSLGLFFSLVISACDSPSKPSATPLSTPPPHTASHRTATFPASMVLRPNQPNALHPRSRLHSRLQPASVRIHSTLSRGDTTRPRAPRSPSSPICSLFQNAPRYALCSGPSLAFVISHRCTVPHQSVWSLRSVVSAVSGLCGQWSLLRTCPQC